MDAKHFYFYIVAQIQQVIYHLDVRLVLIYYRHYFSTDIRFFTSSGSGFLQSDLVWRTTM